jgi:hypothetical protein
MSKFSERIDAQLNGDEQPSEANKKEATNEHGAEVKQQNALQEKPTWYYMLKTEGGEHGFAYDPNKNIIYEVNHPHNGHTNGGVNWIKGLFGKSDGVKSTVYQWNMSNPRQEAAFWAFGKDADGNGGRGKLLLSPVELTNPDAATAFFQSMKGQEYDDYNLARDNCMHYAIRGFAKGGLVGGVALCSPEPSKWPGTYTMSWSSGSRPTPLISPVSGYVRPFPPR